MPTATRTRTGTAGMLDTGHYGRRRAQELRDPEFEAEYLRAREEIAQVDGSCASSTPCVRSPGCPSGACTPDRSESGHRSQAVHR